MTADLRIDGAITYWQTGEYIALDSLKHGLEQLGLEKFVPGPRTPAAALKDALCEHFPGSNHRVERLKEADGFEVVEVTRGSTSNIYRGTMVAKLDANNVIRFAPLGEMAQAIVATYNRHLGQVRGTILTRSLVEIAYHLNGTRLRPEGGVYWLPEGSLDLWAEVGGACLRSSVGGRCKVHVIRHHLDRDAVAAVRDAIAEEVMSEARRLQADMESAELGDKAIETRRHQADALRRKIREYEEILGVGLATLKEAVDAAEQAQMIGELIGAVGAG